MVLEIFQKPLYAGALGAVLGLIGKWIDSKLSSEENKPGFMSYIKSALFMGGVLALFVFITGPKSFKFGGSAPSIGGPTIGSFRFDRAGASSGPGMTPPPSRPPLAQPRPFPNAPLSSFGSVGPVGGSFGGNDRF
jgi:hypothetical protein